MPDIVAVSGVRFGCDPEFFFSKGDQVIGAEKVIKKPLSCMVYGYSGVTDKVNTKALVLDGVQVELNPSPNTCRANLGHEIAASFRALKAHLKSMEGVKASFDAVITLSKDELESLSREARRLGCAPSNNVYDKRASVNVHDVKNFTERSAGGHIHLGFNKTLPHLMPHRDKLVQLLDVILGNTCVLIDRDPGAAIRRQHYGRAGEYRLPVHGLEYRTLSNFWLRSYPLMSFVMGVARLVVYILHTQYMPPLTNRYTDRWDAETVLLSQVDLARVKEAINKNDLKLAEGTWAVVKQFIMDNVQWSTGLDANKIPKFEKFAKAIQEKGIECWFPDDPIEHWSNLTDGHTCGWENFLDKVVDPPPPPPPQQQNPAIMCNVTSTCNTSW